MSGWTAGGHVIYRHKQETVTETHCLTGSILMTYGLPPHVCWCSWEDRLLSQPQTPTASGKLTHQPHLHRQRKLHDRLLWKTEVFWRRPLTLWIQKLIFLLYWTFVLNVSYTVCGHAPPEQRGQFGEFGIVFQGNLSDAPENRRWRNINMKNTCYLPSVSMTDLFEVLAEDHVHSIW